MKKLVIALVLSALIREICGSLHGQDLTMMPQATLPAAAPVIASKHPAATAAKPAALLIVKHTPKPPVKFLVVVCKPSADGDNVATILRGTSDLTAPVKWSVVGSGKTNSFTLPNNGSNQFFQVASVITNL